MADEHAEYWEARHDEASGQVFYWNASTGETSWEPPSHLAGSVAVGSAAVVTHPWTQAYDENGHVYYMNVETMETRWTPPDAEDDGVSGQDATDAANNDHLAVTGGRGRRPSTAEQMEELNRLLSGDGDDDGVQGDTDDSDGHEGDDAGAKPDTESNVKAATDVHPDQPHPSEEATAWASEHSGDACPWMMFLNEGDGVPYYYNHLTEECVWEPPEEFLRFHENQQIEADLAASSDKGGVIPTPNTGIPGTEASHVVTTVDSGETRAVASAQGCRTAVEAAITPEFEAKVRLAIAEVSNTPVGSGRLTLVRTPTEQQLAQRTGRSVGSTGPSCSGPSRPPSAGARSRPHTPTGGIPSSRAFADPPLPLEVEEGTAMLESDNITKEVTVETPSQREAPALVTQESAEQGGSDDTAMLAVPAVAEHDAEAEEGVINQTAGEAESPVEADGQVQLEGQSQVEDDVQSQGVIRGEVDAGVDEAVEAESRVQAERNDSDEGEAVPKVEEDPPSIHTEGHEAPKEDSKPTTSINSAVDIHVTDAAIENEVVPGDPKGLEAEVADTSIEAGLTNGVDTGPTKSQAEVEAQDLTALDPTTDVEAAALVIQCRTRSFLAQNYVQQKRAEHELSTALASSQLSSDDAQPVPATPIDTVDTSANPSEGASVQEGDSSTGDASQSSGGVTAEQSTETHSMLASSHPEGTEAAEVTVFTPHENSSPEETEASTQVPHEQAHHNSGISLALEEKDVPSTETVEVIQNDKVAPPALAPTGISAEGTDLLTISVENTSDVGDGLGNDGSLPLSLSPSSGSSVRCNTRKPKAITPVHDRCPPKRELATFTTKLPSVLDISRYFSPRSVRSNVPRSEAPDCNASSTTNKSPVAINRKKVEVCAPSPPPRLTSDELEKLQRQRESAMAAQREEEQRVWTAQVAEYQRVFAESKVAFETRRQRVVHTALERERQRDHEERVETSRRQSLKLHIEENKTQENGQRDVEDNLVWELMKAQTHPTTRSAERFESALQQTLESTQFVNRICAERFRELQERVETLHEASWAMETKLEALELRLMAERNPLSERQRPLQAKHAAQLRRQYRRLLNTIQFWQHVLDEYEDESPEGYWGRMRSHYAAPQFRDEEMRRLYVLRERRGAWGGDSLLHVAAWNGWEAHVRLLIAQGADVNLEDTSASHTTPLLEACRAGHTPVVQLLLDSGARLDAVDASGDSALHVASRSGWTRTVRVLLLAASEREEVAADAGAERGGLGPEVRSSATSVLTLAKFFNLRNGKRMRAVDVATVPSLIEELEHYDRQLSILEAEHAQEEAKLHHKKHPRVLKKKRKPISHH